MKDKIFGNFWKFLELSIFMINKFQYFFGKVGIFHSLQQ
jgi:hypothetical protein